MNHHVAIICRSLHTMATKVFNRSYLQSLPEIHKKEAAEVFLRNFESGLMEAASNGETSYFYDITHVIFKEHCMPAATKKENDNSQRFTTNDLIDFMKEKFPDCSVTLTQKFVDTNLNIQNLLKGIIVDWS